MAIVFLSCFTTGLTALQAVFELIFEVPRLNDVVLAADEVSIHQIVLFLKGDERLVVGLSLPI